jgi:hypothetical protein
MILTEWFPLFHSIAERNLYLKIYIKKNTDKNKDTISEENEKTGTPPIFVEGKFKTNAGLFLDGLLSISRN